MTSEQITPAQCAALSGLHSNEMLLGVSSTARHDSLYASYRLHDESGWQAVRDMIVADIRASLDLGASKQAADLLIVLRRFLSERVAVVVVRNLRGPPQIVSFPSSAGLLRTSRRGIRSEAGGCARASRPSRY
jgi:hypothetical protein